MRWRRRPRGRRREKRSMTRRARLHARRGNCGPPCLNPQMTRRRPRMPRLTPRAAASSLPVYQGDGDEAPAMAERRSPTLAASRGSPSPVVGGGSSAPTTERRSPQPATGEGVPAPTMLSGGDASAVSAEASAQMASRPQPAPRVTPSDQASRGIGVPRARRSGTGKRSMSAR